LIIYPFLLANHFLLGGGGGEVLGGTPTNPGCPLGAVGGVGFGKGKSF
jgi:hypothetical protein